MRLSTGFAVLFCALVVAAGPAAAGTDCHGAAIERLRNAAPAGFAVYRQIADKKFFLGWIDCGEPQFGLPTAVHESVHYITAETDAFPLFGGGALKRPHDVSAFFAPSLIAAKFKPNDFVTTYLRPGSASSAGDFLYLLDELNAYTHDLNTAVSLSRAEVTAAPGDEQTDHRDGLAALMAFVALYVERAEQSEPATWSGLTQPRVARTVSELWTRAETVMASSCGIPNFGSEDKTLIRQFCQRGPQAALQKIIGRAPICPAACLKEMPVASRDFDAMTTGSVRTRSAAPVPFFSRSPSRSDQ
jgi:hypothetical protein